MPEPRPGGDVERYFFVHLQKTAGTSVLQGLQHQYGREAVYPGPDDERHPNVHTDIDHLRTVFERRGDEIRVVAGHFPLCTAELLGVPFRTFTVLRDPTQRTLSFLRHRRAMVPDLAERSLLEVFRDPTVLHGMVHDHMTKMLGLAVDQLRLPNGMLTMVPVDDALLARAVANLEAIDVVGVQERFAELWTTLEERFGWDLGPPRHVNRTEARQGEVPMRLALAVKGATRHDRALYDHALELVSRRRRT